ncbi:MAG: TonB-dependent receptor [Psychroflexus sp.]
MQRILILFFIVLSSSLNLYAQEKDSLSQVQELKSVDIIAYFSKQPILGLTSAGESISTNLIETQQNTSLLPSLNTVSGLRMEERSPGSYRLAMRGSLIRSPFGVRNIKIYLDEFALTDAGGNTYLNLIDPASLSSVNILKGPDGSLYGANSGGVIRLQPHGFSVNKNKTSLQVGGGSYGLFQEQVSVQRKVNDEYSFSIDQSLTRSDGYRDHTALNKKTLQTAHKWKYSKNNTLRFLALYSDLEYQTPGGLTESQLEENRRMSRPASDPNPSAKEQNAGIYNETFFGGIAHDAQISKKLKHSISIFGSTTDFENPFITNYEFRTEENIGLRSYFSFKDDINQNFKYQMQIGFEGQKGWNSIDNFDNNQGSLGSTQAKDNLDNSRVSYFYRAKANLFKRWTIEASLGLNQVKIDYRTRFPVVQNPEGEISFGSVWMPRVATSYLINDGLAIRASISKGYSPPTIAEVRSSDNTINTDLEAETGVNYELGLRYETENKRFIADLSFYNYKMNNGIVRQLNDNGNEYYVNAGEINQNGIEASFWANLINETENRFIRNLKLKSALTYNHYRFGTYKVKDNNFSDNKVTSVPDWVVNNTLFIKFTQNLNLNISHNYTSEIPLNDANTVYSKAYHLIQMKGIWKWNISNTTEIEFFTGVDNLLNEDYSLGNDINAYGQRYFNPAAKRNYFGGMKLSL